jgi:RNA polymerase sigma factor (sigma-70 family)
VSGPPVFDPGRDAELVDRCLAGDARAWDELLSRHQRLVYSVIRSWRLSDEDGADVFQDVFAALVRGLPRLRDARSLVRWLASTTDRIARAVALRRRREQALSGGPAPLETLAADAPALGDDLEALEQQAMVRLALEELPEGCRRLLQALYYDDPTPSYAAVALRLGVPVGSLGPTRARCMARLKRALERLEGIRASAGPTFPGDGSHPSRSSPRRVATEETR